MKQFVFYRMLYSHSSIDRLMVGYRFDKFASVFVEKPAEPCFIPSQISFERFEDPSVFRPRVLFLA